MTVTTADRAGLARRQATLLLWGLVAAGVVARLLVFRGQGFPSDVGTFMAWAERMAEVGPGAFYAPGYFSDYPPGFLYVLWLVGALFDGEALRLVVKMLSLPADIAIAVLVARLVRPAAGPTAAALAGGAWMLQPAVIYAGPIWGQVDAWGTLPFLAALVAAGSGRWALAGALAGIAGMVKPQFGIVAVVVAGAALIELARGGRWRPLPQVALSGLAAALVLAIPFGMTPGVYVELVRSAAGTYPYTSLFAFNGWSIVGDFWKPDDAYVAAGGALLVLGLAGSVLSLWRRRDVGAFLAAGALAAMAFYFLPTRAHERYLFPAFAVLLPLVAVRPRLRWPYAVLSGGFLATLYFAFSRYAFTEVTAPPLLEATIFSRGGQIALALVMIGSALVLAWLLVRGEARLRAVAPARAAEPAAASPGWRLPAGLRLGHAPTRRDVAVALLIALAVIATRGYRLEDPRDMYFDEIYHARTAMELLAQRDVYEWTHPHLAKEIMALGILAFGGDRVERAETAPDGVTAFAVSHAGVRAYGFADGRVTTMDRSGSGVRVTVLDGPVRALAFDGASLHAATDRSVTQLPQTAVTGAPADVSTGSTQLGAAPTAFVSSAGRAVVGTSRDLLIVTPASGSPPLVVPIPVAALTAKPDSSEVFVADPTGLIHVVDVATGRVTGTIAGGPPVTALAYARGPDHLIGAQRGEAALTWYEPPRLEGGGQRAGSHTGTVRLENDRTRGVAGEVRALAMVPRSQMLYALTEHGVVVVDPHGMSPFAAFAAGGSMLGVDGEGDLLLVAGEGATEVVPTGRHALAWRVPGVLFAGILAFFVVLLARRLFASRVAPLLAGLVVLLDGSMLAQARIAINDIYVATFIVIGWYFVVAAHRPRRSATLDLVIAGAAFGLALASKWVAAYALAGLALATIVVTAVAWARGRPGSGGPFDLLGPTAAAAPEGADPRLWWALRFARRAGLLLACFGALPAAIYLASYARWFGGTTIPYGWDLWQLTQQMYWYHSGLTAPHPAGSPWWSWPLVLKPVYWYLSTGNGMTAVIYDAGNLVLFWGALAAVVWAAVAAWRSRSFGLAVLLFALLTQYVAWIPITRVLFFYHFFTALPFYLLILSAALVALWERGRAPLVATYLAVAAAALVFFYPFLTGVPVPADQAGVFFVLPTWQHDCQFYPQFRCDSAFSGEIPFAAATGRLAVALGSALLALAAVTVAFRQGGRLRRLVPRRAQPRRT